MVKILDKSKYEPIDMSEIRLSERFLAAMEQVTGQPRDVSKRNPPLWGLMKSKEECAADVRRIEAERKAARQS